MPLRNNPRRHRLVGKGMIILLAAVLMLPLQPRAQAAPTDTTQQTSAGSLKLAAARAAYSVVAEVDHVDQLAQKAQVAFLKAAKSAMPDSSSTAILQPAMHRTHVSLNVLLQLVRVDHTHPMPQLHRPC